MKHKKCPSCFEGNLKKSGKFGKNRVQCNKCNHVFIVFDDKSVMEDVIKINRGTLIYNKELYKY